MGLTGHHGADTWQIHCPVHTQCPTLHQLLETKQHLVLFSHIKMTEQRFELIWLIGLSWLEFIWLIGLSWFELIWLIDSSKDFSCKRVCDLQFSLDTTDISLWVSRWRQSTIQLRYWQNTYLSCMEHAIHDEFIELEPQCLLDIIFVWEYHTLYLMSMVS